jgi:phage major head subunit gpT-like protein
MQINQSNLTTLFQGFKVLFVSSFQGSAPLWPKIAMRATSTNASENYNWLGAVPGMKKMLGEAVIENLTACQYQIANDEFESTIGVKRAEIERDNEGLYAPLISSMGLAAAQHPDELIGTLLSGGFTTKDYTTKNFYDTAKKHEPNNSRSTTFTNKSTEALDPASYSVAKAALKGMKNAKGRSMKLGNNLMLVVPPALEDTAREILQAERSENGKTNIQRGTADLLVFPDLATDTEWHLLECGQPVKALIFQEEKTPEFHRQDDETSDHVFLKKEFLYQAYGRYNAGYGLPQLAYGSTGVA